MAYAKETTCVQGSNDGGDCYGAVSYPIYMSATYAHPELGETTGYAYGRVANPTRDQLQRTVALLEHGEEALAFSTGMAAITAVFDLFGPGDHIIATDDIYGGTLRLWDSLGKKIGLEVSSVDTTDLGELEAAIRPNTRAIFLETPSNPMMKVTDIQGAAGIAKRHGCILIVDNTFLSPYFQQPLNLGADIVVHSGTKYLGGHNDVLAGFTVTKDEELGEKLKYIYKTTGSSLSPMDSWLVLRGIKTLAIRMEQHQKNALEIAEWLKQQPKVREVYYIGLPDRPDKDLIDRQCSGYGGMISFRVDSEETVKSVLKNVKLIRFAESLGGVESLLTFPAEQTHREVPEELRRKLGVDETLLRLSVGIENSGDLIADLEQALA
ncbi:MAG: trans-sulfuration enzyme family protein [Acetatifactor sp.]